MQVKLRKSLGTEKIIVLSPNVVVHEGMNTFNVFIHGELGIHIVNSLASVTFTDVMFKKYNRRTIKWFFRKHRQYNWILAVEEEWKKIITNKEKKND